ncbi:MAG TPA: response regulator [Thermoanaerobaculia bacterium]|nr:response regulator [Thermoanaerobaculia bacterium]
MEITCKHCTSKFRAAVQLPLTKAVRVACPLCNTQVVLKPATGDAPFHGPTPTVPSTPAPVPRPVALAGHSLLRPARHPGRRVAGIADEPRPFRAFLGDQLRKIGFEVAFFETGEPLLEFVHRTRAQLVIVNVYLKGKLGVDVTDAIRADPTLHQTRVILIGALFRANRFRANPTNLYGADEYIEEQIPEREFRQIVRRLFPEVGDAAETALEPREYDAARRLARLILSDIIIYHTEIVERGIREDNFFDLLKTEIEDGRAYFESRVPSHVRHGTSIYQDTLQQFVQMKREELDRLRTGTEPS